MRSAKPYANTANVAYMYALETIESKDETIYEQHSLAVELIHNMIPERG